MTEKPTHETISIEMPEIAERIEHDMINLYNFYLDNAIPAQLIFASLSAGLGIIAGYQNANSSVPHEVILTVRDANFNLGFTHGQTITPTEQDKQADASEPEPTHPIHPTKQ